MLRHLYPGPTSTMQLVGPGRCSYPGSSVPSLLKLMPSFHAHQSHTLPFSDTTMHLIQIKIITIIGITLILSSALFQHFPSSPTSTVQVVGPAGYKHHSNSISYHRSHIFGRTFPLFHVHQSHTLLFPDATTAASYYVGTHHHHVF